jgi:hypothetical protein
VTSDEDGATAREVIGRIKGRWREESLTLYLNQTKTSSLKSVEYQAGFQICFSSPLLGFSLIFKN